MVMGRACIHNIRAYFPCANCECPHSGSQLPYLLREQATFGDFNLPETRLQRLRCAVAVFVVDSCAMCAPHYNDSQNNSPHASTRKAAVFRMVDLRLVLFIAGLWRGDLMGACHDCTHPFHATTDCKT